MSDPDSPRRDEHRKTTREVAHEVEAEIEELGDPEAGPGLPATTLAARGTVPDHATSAPVAFEPAGARSAYAEIARLGWPVMLSQILVSPAWWIAP
jgi:hypothetical protein